MPAGWELAQRISADALAMLHGGEPSTAEIILKKGEALTMPLTLGGNACVRMLQGCGLCFVRGSPHISSYIPPCHSRSLPVCRHWRAAG